MKKLLLIDTFNFLHRAYHALPKTFTDSEGNPTNAIYGVSTMLLNIFETIQPDYAVAALESKSPLNRLDESEDYKAHRKPMEDTLKMQIDPAIAVIESFGIQCVVSEGYEADDVIGTIVTQNVVNPDLELIIASNDRDLWQLVRSNVLIMLPNTKGNVEWVGEKEVEARLGFPKDKIIDYKSLKGDSSDNIPGVAGIGDKTAKQLLEQFGSLENIYANLESISSASVRKKLEKDRENAFMSKRLATIVTDVPTDFSLDKSRFKEINKIAIKSEFEKHNFKSLIRRLGLGDDVLGNRSSNKKVNAVNDGQLSLF